MNNLFMLSLFVFNLNTFANPATPEDNTISLVRFVTNPELIEIECSTPYNPQDIENKVNQCGWAATAPQDIWRNLNGSKSAYLENGKIVLTYSITGCPNIVNFHTDSFPSCGEFQNEINEVFDFFQEHSNLITFRRVESNSNITVNFEGESANAYVERHNSDNKIALEAQPASALGRFQVNQDTKNRSSRSTISINNNKCHWITDRSICTSPGRRKPIDTPDIKTLVLHELMHALGFKHTRCNQDLSIVGPNGGHGHYHLNDFDLTMLNMYYTEVINSYQTL